MKYQFADKDQLPDPLKQDENALPPDLAKEAEDLGNKVGKLEKIMDTIITEVKNE